MLKKKRSLAIFDRLGELIEWADMLVCVVENLHKNETSPPDPVVTPTGTSGLVVRLDATKAV